MSTPAATSQTAAKWYEIKALSTMTDSDKRSVDIFVYGDIGSRWDEYGITAIDLVREISALDVETINVRINSYGGSVPDGLAIYNALRRHKAAINVFVDGVAISCASYIAMAGDTVTMAKNAQMMIHAPWTWSDGNAVELREQADVLDRYAKAMAPAYADKSGKTYEQALAILTDGKDHWFLADEAVAEGFADEVGEEVAVAASLVNSFDLSRFKPQQQPAPAAQALPPVSQPAATAATTLEAPMPDPVIPAVQPAVPFARTKSDNDVVINMFKPFASQPAIQALQTEVLADPALTIETIQARLLAKMGEGQTPANPQGAHPIVSTVSDEVDKKQEAAVNALLVRAGVKVSDTVRASMGSNPFRGHTLLDMARASLARAGVNADGMDKMEVVSTALNMGPRGRSSRISGAFAAFTQGTSDFPVLLENAMHKAMQSAYALQAFTWSRFCATGSVSDFRAHNRYRLGSFGSLDALNELGEFTNKSIPDGEKASMTAATKGNVINLSRQAIINDDLGAFVGLASMLGRAAGRTVEADVYALLALNAGLGPVMGDGKTLFHADHGNITTAAALAMAAIDADRVAMASQKDVSGNDFLDLRPAVLVLPIGLGGTARSINEAQYDPDTANKLQKPNVVNGLFRDIVDTPRMTGTRRYLFADASEAPVLEVAFLDGKQEPYLEREEGFDVDGSRFKVRLDYGVGAIDYRGAVTNAGG